MRVQRLFEYLACRKHMDLEDDLVNFVCKTNFNLSYNACDGMAVVTQKQCLRKHPNPCETMISSNIKNLSPKKYLRRNILVMFAQLTGGRLNKKDGLTRYGDSHVKDETS